MSEVTQELNIEMRKKLSDGNYRVEYPLTKVENVIGASKFIAGQYSGDGVSLREIEIGSKAIFIIVKNTFNANGALFFYDRGTNSTYYLEGTAIKSNSNLKITETGFQVVSTVNNGSNGVFDYIAFLED